MLDPVFLSKGCWCVGVLFLFWSGMQVFACANSIFTFVPSDAGGDRGIAVKVVTPVRCRYVTGCPVVVSVSGGWGGEGGGTG
jgi:hypothetical protein